MKLEIFLLVIVGSIFISKCSAEDSGIAVAAIRCLFPSSPCVQAGLICDGCNRIALCVALPNGRFRKQRVQTCWGRTYCESPATGPVCTAGPNPLCDGTASMSYPCTSTGVFPDPFFCESYRFCLRAGSSGRRVRCPAGMIFNVETSACDILRSSPEADAICNANGNNIYPIPVCKAANQAGVTANPSVYYVCKLRAGRLYPNLYRCALGESYNVATNKCESTTTQPPSTTITEPSISTQDPSVPTTDASSVTPDPPTSTVSPTDSTTEESTTVSSSDSTTEESTTVSSSDSTTEESTTVSSSDSTTDEYTTLTNPTT